MKTILLIEDDLFIRQLYERILSRAGFKIISANSGSEGLKLAKSKPDLILLDIILPRISGIDVLKSLKEDINTQNIPVVLLTNLAEDQMLNKAFKLGAQGYLLKARVKPSEIVNHIKNFLPS